MLSYTAWKVGSLNLTPVFDPVVCVVVEFGKVALTLVNGKPELFMDERELVEVSEAD